MTTEKEQKKNLIVFYKEEQSILRIMANPNCGASMYTTWEAKLQECRNRILDLIRPMS
jgi:hypothetical protein